MAAKHSNIEIMENTELIKLTPEKYQYINTAYEKVSVKMYDGTCDLRLRVGKQSFRVHRDVLIQASDYFAAMFGHDMKEKEQREVELYDISPQGFTCMLEYFYHGHITVTADNIEDILEASRFFHIEWLMNVSCDFLIRHMSLENYSVVMELADHFALGDLRKEIFRFIGMQFSALAKEKIMMHMSHELFHTLLSECSVIEASENIVLHTLVRWLQFEPEERKEFVLPFMKLIRFPLVSDMKLLDNIPPEFCDNEIQQYVNEAKEYHTFPPKQCLLQTERTQARGSKKFVTLFSALEDANLIQYKIPGEPDFLTEEIDTGFMQSFFEFSSVAVLGNFLFIAGGYDRHNYVSSPAFYRYNPRDRSWDNLTSMHHPRVSFPLCAAPDGLYAINGVDHVTQGGFDRELILHSVEFYDPSDNKWHMKPELPFGCFSAAAATIGDVVYLSGGITDDPEDVVPVHHLHAYNPDTRRWQEKAPMITPRQSHAMVSIGQKLYVFGGYSAGPDTMSFSDCLLAETYDADTDQWTDIKPIPEAMMHCYGTATVFQSKVFILGGPGEEPDRFICAYNTETDEMEEAEYCGVSVCKLVTLQTALPTDLD